MFFFNNHLLLHALLILTVVLVPGWLSKVVGVLVILIGWRIAVTHGLL